MLTDFSGHKDIARAIHDTAYEYRKLGRYDKADQLDQYVIDHWPIDVQAMWAKMDMAKTDIWLGNDAAAQEAINNLIADFSDNPDLPEAVFAIGEQYYYKAFDDPDRCTIVKSQDHLNKAKHIWERIIAQWPQSQSIGLKHAYYFSAVCYHKLGEHTKAAEYFQKVVDDYPAYQYAWSAQCLIGECYEKLRDSGVLSESEANPKIEESYIAVIEKYPDSSVAAHAHLQLANMKSQANQWAEAAAYFESFLEKYPQDKRYTRVLYDLGRAYERMGELERAAEIYRILTEILGPEDSRIETVRANLKKLEGAQK